MMLRAGAGVLHFHAGVSNHCGTIFATPNLFCRGAILCASIDNSVLDSLRPVIEASRDSHMPKIAEVANWMGYEELPLPEFALPFGIGAVNANEAIDFIKSPIPSTPHSPISRRTSSILLSVPGAIVW